MGSHRLPALGLVLLLQASGCTAPFDEGERLQAGAPLGDHELESAGGARIRTSELGSRVLLFHFFETGSESCKAQVRPLLGLWYPHRGDGLNVLGVCPETDRGDILRTTKEWNLPYPVFHDPDGTFARQLAPPRYPWNVVVGRDGKILLSGQDGWDRVRAVVKEAIQAKVEGPERVTVQHILISFRGAATKSPAPRSMEEAAKLAAELLERSRGGDDFGELVKEHSSDPVPGVYQLVNFTVEADDDIEEVQRGALVQAFGDVAFSLEVDEVGLAEYHSIRSPSGWHIIKRLK